MTTLTYRSILFLRLNRVLLIDHNNDVYIVNQHRHTKSIFCGYHQHRPIHTLRSSSTIQSSDRAGLTWPIPGSRVISSQSGADLKTATAAPEVNLEINESTKPEREIKGKNRTTSSDDLGVARGEGTGRSGTGSNPRVSSGLEGGRVEAEMVKSFQDIPGPRGLPYFGVLFHYKWGGRYRPTQYHKALLAAYRRYGKIFKQTLNGVTTVHLFHPDYVQTVYQNVGRLPYIVPLLETTQMYRKYRGMSPGLGNSNGEEWYQLRTAVQRIMLVPRTVPTFLPVVNEVVDDFMERLQQIRDTRTGRVEKFNNEVAKWNLESSAKTCFEIRLGCLEAGPDSWQQRLVDANNRIFDLSLKMSFSVPWYRLFATPTWRKLITAEDFFFGTGQKMVDEACQRVRDLIKDDSFTDNDSRYVFLRYLIGRKDLSYKELSIITLSLFADGLSTTTPTLVGQLYCLATNPEKQEKLYEEIQRIAPDKNQPITDEIIQQASYLRGCIKEGFRFFPVGTDVSRILPKDVVVGGYQIPAWTPVSLHSNLLLGESQYFNRPNEYHPERWVRGSQTTSDDYVDDKIHPYLLLPFGHGTRMCAGMRLAEQEMRVLIIKLLQRYRLEWPAECPPMEQDYVMLLRPNCAGNFRFAPRRQ